MSEGNGSLLATAGVFNVVNANRHRRLARAHGSYPRAAASARRHQRQQRLDIPQREARRLQFWTAYAYRDGQRNVFSTSELRHLPLDDQAPSLCEQLEAFVARLQTTPAADILFLGISGVLHPSTSLYLLARGVQPWGDNHRRYEGVPTLVRALAPYPSVRIVLTSTQPWAHSLATVIAELGPLGARVDGFTFEILNTAGMSGDDYWRLDKSGIVYATVELLKPRAWAAIDDEGMRWSFDVRENQLVRTDGCEGLLTADIQDRLHTVLAGNFR